MADAPEAGGRLTFASRETGTHTRVRHDRIDQAGVVILRLAGGLHNIGVGRTYARTCVMLLIEDLDVRIIDAVAGELLWELTVDPTRDYQPQQPRQ
ncbi:hypothetical protein ACFFV7_32310 [Nonomuraea spiralis]|uniref:Uncharacterized protein n=1 Tax=Nonomuraea spiralis TaxID=46182 RepID=A0ABV5IN19_9ACTN|nr:hypothetical protein [Nonomuraea spiralis]GGT38498.1 hypothetical protein GCM10010176_098180 [Nonomuraea spiralis]